MQHVISLQIFYKVQDNLGNVGLWIMQSCTCSWSVIYSLKTSDQNDSIITKSYKEVEEHKKDMYGRINR